MVKEDGKIALRSGVDVIDVTDKDKSTHLRLPRGIREFVNVEEKTHGLLSLTLSGSREDNRRLGRRLPGRRYVNTS